MIPTAATSAVSTQTASTATIGICSLILEGRALSDDEFIITNNFKRHVLLNPPGYVNRPNINIITNPSADFLSSTSTSSSSSSSTTLFKSLTVSTGCGASTTTSAIATPSTVGSCVNSTASDSTLQHYQRLRQKLTQLRQSSPSTSLEPYQTGEQKIIVGGPTASGVGGGGSTTASSPDPTENQFGEDNQNEILLPRFLPRRSSNAGVGGGGASGIGFSGSNLGITGVSSDSGGSGLISSGVGQNQMNQSSDNNLLYSLQSLATTCLWTSSPRAFGRNRDYTDQQQQSTNLYTGNNTLTSETSKYFMGSLSSGGSNSNNSFTNSNCSTTSNINISNNQNKIDSDYGYKNTITVPPKQGPHCDQFLKKLGMMGGGKINSCNNLKTNSNTTSTNKILDYEEHVCDMANLNEVCYHWQIHCRQMEVMLSRSDPICIEVYLGPENHEILLEQWIIEDLDIPTTPSMTLQSLCNAIRSQLYFSQITAWTDLIKKLHPYDKEIIENCRIKKTLLNLNNSTTNNTMLLNNKKPRLDIYYRIKPYDSTASFNSKPIVHNFPNVIISDNCAISVCLKSLPRLQNGIPKIDESTTAHSTTTIQSIIPSVSIPIIINHQNNSNNQQQNLLMTSQINDFGSSNNNNNNINNGCTSSSSSGIGSEMNISSTSNNIELLRSTTPAPSDCSDLQLNDSMLLDDRLDIIPCQEMGKHKCAYDEDDDEEEEEEEGSSSDNFGECSSGSGTNGGGSSINSAINNGNSNNSIGGCSNSGNNNNNNVSHREKQLMKYRKRMMKRDKKKKIPEQSHILLLEQQNLQNNSTNRNSTIVSNNSSSSCVNNGNNNNCQLIKLENGCSNNIDSTYVEQPEFGSINSMRPPLYQTAKHSIAEAVQTQSVEMISIGTQTIFPSNNTNNNNSVVQPPNCDQCNNEMTFVCLNCCDVTMKNHENCNCHSNLKKTAAIKSNCIELKHNQQHQQPEVLCKADLLLQAIQRTPKSGNNKFNNNNNSSVTNYRKYDIGDRFSREVAGGGASGINSISNKDDDAKLNDCQLCKRQKTQHNYKSNDDNFTNNNNNNNYNFNNNNCCTLNEKCTLKKSNFGNVLKCNCSSTLQTLTVKMDDDDQDNNSSTDTIYYGYNKILTTAIQSTTDNLKILKTSNNTEEKCCTPSNSNKNILSNNNILKTPIKKSELGLNISSTIISPLSLYNDITAQFKTPKSGYISPKNQQNYNQLNNNNNNTEKCISSMKKALPKINLSNVFCNQSSLSSTSTLPIPICNNLLSDKISKNSISINNINLSSTSSSSIIKITTPPEIPVQKSNSAPTLPNSPSLSPRFIKQAAIYKRRSRHLSDRSERSSLGSDEQLSDEDLDSFGFSPAGSPIKNKFFNRISTAFGRRPLLGNLEESLLQKRFVPKTQVAGFKVLLGASGGFCPTQLTIPAAAYFYELDGQALSTPYLCEIRLSRKGYTIPRVGTVQATLLNPIGTVVRMFVIPYDLRDMPPMNQTFIRQRILAVDSETPIDIDSGCNGDNSNNTKTNGICNGSSFSGIGGGNCSVQNFTKEQMRSLRYSIHLRFQTSRSGRLALHTDIRLLISRRTDCDTAAAHAKGALESPNELKILTQQPDNPKYSARQDTNPNKI